MRHSSGVQEKKPFILRPFDMLRTGALRTNGTNILQRKVAACGWQSEV